MCVKNKSSQLFAALLLPLLIYQYASAEIKNGYGYGITIVNMKDSLSYFADVLSMKKDLPASQRRNIKCSMSRLMQAIAYYETTEKLLLQFNSISPDLYYEISALTNARGVPVDVYVKLVPQDGTRLQSWGTTYLARTPHDRDATSSEYGENTVSVKVWLVSDALRVLAHELGHVKYMVPNLSEYMVYYSEHYVGRINQFSVVGHDVTDLSGRSASAYVELFQQDYKCFQRANQGYAIENALVIREKIRRDIIGMYCCRKGEQKLVACNSVIFERSESNLP